MTISVKKLATVIVAIVLVAAVGLGAFFIGHNVGYNKGLEDAEAALIAELMEDADRLYEMWSDAEYASFLEEFNEEA